MRSTINPNSHKTLNTELRNFEHPLDAFKFSNEETFTLLSDEYEEEREEPLRMR